MALMENTSCMYVLSYEGCLEENDLESDEDIIYSFQTETVENGGNKILLSLPPTCFLVFIFGVHLCVFVSPLQPCMIHELKSPSQFPSSGEAFNPQQQQFSHLARR